MDTQTHHFFFLNNPNQNGDKKNNNNHSNVKIKGYVFDGERNTHEKKRGKKRWDWLNGIRLECTVKKDCALI